MAAPTTRPASTPRADAPAAQDGLGIRVVTRGRLKAVVDASGREIAVFDPARPEASFEAAAVALLSHGRAVGRREAFGAVRSRLDGREVAP